MPSPGRSLAWCAPLPPHPQQSCPTRLLLPHSWGWTEPATACGVCKTYALFPGLCEISCFVLLMCAMPTCSLAAHSLQHTSLFPFSPFCLVFGWGKLPTPGVRRNAENEVKGAKISQGRFFKADPPLGPMSVRRACSTQLHHAVRKRDLESNPHMQLFLLLPWIESPWQGRKVNPSLGGRLCQPCRQSVLQQGAV